MKNIAESVYILYEIEKLRKERERLLIAIDGRCAAGKTTYAAHLQEAYGCNVIHMDDFYLRQEQRTIQRLNEPGGNVDYERFLEEALIPLSQGQAFSYRPYNCHTRKMLEPIRIKPHSINIIEGAYSCHPALKDYYDLRIFMSVEAKEQLKRIRQRSGEARAVDFIDKWIPLEEQYISFCHVRENSDLLYTT